MSLINDLLTSISKNPGITAQELADELKQDLNRVRNNLYVNTNLVTKKRDDVTRRPGYHLTAEGKAKLKTGAADLTDAPEPTTAAAPVVTAEPAPAPATESILPRAEVSPIHALQARIDDMQHELSKLHAENARLQAQLRTAETARHAPTTVPVGYLITAPKRKPRRFTSRPHAADAALKAVRAGAARADVFALIPAGTARRGVEWTDPQEP
jgi:DNA-binding MarR family transcriptional regulator